MGQSTTYKVFQKYAEGRALPKTIPRKFSVYKLENWKPTWYAIVQYLYYNNGISGIYSRHTKSKWVIINSQQEITIIEAVLCMHNNI